MGPAETILHQRSISALAAPAHMAGHRVTHVHSLGPERVGVPPLPTGGHFFGMWPVRELPDQGRWAAPAYDSFAPPVFVLHDVVVHSSAGILAVGDTVVAESLANTTPHVHGYRALAKGIAIEPERVERLVGSHISMLAGGETDYRHALLDGVARLSSVPDAYLTASAGLLVSDSPAQAELLGLFDPLPSLAVRRVGQGETLRVETLVLPLSVSGESVYHPCVRDFFRRVSANVPPSPMRLPRRVYLDQRGTGIRPLRNEDDVIAALTPLGFLPVRLDLLSLSDQIRLFRQAEAIVAPHSSALANLGFARPGCLVIELHMDAYVDWSFRNLAAVTGLRYDCVLGRAHRPWQELTATFHSTPWDISVNHVAAAAAHSLGSAALVRPAAARAA